jgi:hypothetical protein
MKSTYVLVPGAWLGKWAWDRVTPILESEGHAVYPITLPGLAERASELSPAVGLMSHVTDLVDTCQRLDLENVILLGHSYAGAVVGAAARRRPNLFSAQVYLDTMPLPENSSFLDGFSPEGKAKFENSLINQKGTRVWPMPEPLNSQAPTEGMSEEDLELLGRKGTPQPAKTFEEPLSGPIEREPFPKCYAISCVEDENAAAVEKKQFLVSRPDWEYYSLPKICHWPMFSSPRELASILIKIGQDVGLS